MPASDRERLEVDPAMNHRSSAMTARMKTRLVVRRGKIGVGGVEGLVEGREREKRSGGGAKRDRVPVPVLEHYKLRFMGNRLPSDTCLDDVRRLAGFCGSNQGIGAPHAVEKKSHR